LKDIMSDQIYLDKYDKELFEAAWNIILSDSKKQIIVFS
jgi:hypothetical protein